MACDALSATPLESARLMRAAPRGPTRERFAAIFRENAGAKGVRAVPQ